MRGCLDQGADPDLQSVPSHLVTLVADTPWEHLCLLLALLEGFKATDEPNKRKGYRGQRMGHYVLVWVLGPKSQSSCLLPKGVPDLGRGECGAMFSVAGQVSVAVCLVAHITLANTASLGG